MQDTGQDKNTRTVQSVVFLWKNQTKLRTSKLLKKENIKKKWHKCSKEDHRFPKTTVSEFREHILCTTAEPYVGKTKSPMKKIYITQVNKIENLNQQQQTFLYFLKSKKYAFSALSTGIGM